MPPFDDILEANANYHQENTKSFQNIKITVQNKGQEIDFETLKKEFWLSKENESTQITKFNKEGKRDKIQRPYETAQQKAAKRANKLLDSKRQQEVEKIAAEKLGSHEKKCPICELPFKDVNEFMTHLSKCNVVESSEEELENTEKEETRVVDKEEEGDEENEAVREEPTNINDVNLPGESNKIKVFPYLLSIILLLYCIYNCSIKQIFY